MKTKNVPQDKISTYAENKKAIYAVDEDGRIKVVPSSGWSVEETVTKQALDDLEQLAADAYCQVKRGLKSPLFYYMYAMRMDLQVLSESTGFFKWRIKRDFKPEVFAKITNKRLEVYASALGKDIADLVDLEDKDYDCK